jgi:hypothetical protein
MKHKIYWICYLLLDFVLGVASLIYPIWFENRFIELIFGVFLLVEIGFKLSLRVFRKSSRLFPLIGIVEGCVLILFLTFLSLQYFGVFPYIIDTIHLILSGVVIYGAFELTYVYLQTKRNQVVFYLFYFFLYSAGIVGLFCSLHLFTICLLFALICITYTILHLVDWIAKSKLQIND